MRLDIRSYLGAAPLVFDMSIADARSVCGAPKAQRRLRTAIMLDFLDFGFRLHFDLDDRLREIEVIQAGIMFFESCDVCNCILDLASADDRASLVGSVLLLPAYGIASTGFHTSRPQDQAVGVYRRDLWAQDLETRATLWRPAVSRHV